MKTKILAGDKTKETGDNSSDAFEIIKCKRKSADNKQETRQDDKKKKPKSNNDNVPKSAQKTNPKNDNDALKKSQILVKKESAHSGGVTTRSGASKNIKSRKGEEISDGNNSEDEVTSYTCNNICKETFKNYSQYKTHKISCTKIPKKFVCSKCSKGFTARCYLTQHFDFKHTNKPKKYYCKLCNKYFELEKTMNEHNRWLHNDGDYKYLCDFCN